MRRVGTLLVALLVVLPVGAALAQGSGTGIGIQLLEAPRALEDNPRARLYIIDEVDPGATFDRLIRVSNNSGERRQIDLYSVGASTEDGWTVEPGREQNELARWITVDPPTVSLGPGEAVEASVTVDVPNDALPGERYAAVLAAGPPTGDGGQVSVISRVGIRVYLFVRGEQPPAEDFEIDTLAGARDEDGTPFVLVGVTNTGERAIDVSGELMLTEGPGSLSAGPFPVTVPRTVGPRDSGQVRVALEPDLPVGPWLARADLRSGMVERAAEATISFPDQPGENSAPVAAEDVPLHRDRGVLVPVATGLIILTVVLLGLFWFSWHATATRRTRR